MGLIVVIALSRLDRTRIELNEGASDIVGHCRHGAAADLRRLVLVGRRCHLHLPNYYQVLVDPIVSLVTYRRRLLLLPVIYLPTLLVYRHYLAEASFCILTDQRPALKTI